MLFQGDGDENFFLADGAAAATRRHAEQIPPREYVFIVDVSGSMHGFPLDTAKTLHATTCIGRLRPTDTLQRPAVLRRHSRAVADTRCPPPRRTSQRA